jgi:pyruvate-ferredoxin/flavodoxin oxidoreductase
MERRKAWRMLQSKAGVASKDYQAQKVLLAKLDKGELQLADVQAQTKELFDAEVAKLN